METQHKVSIGEYRETIPEQQARRIFRNFTPEMFEETFSTVLCDPEKIMVSLGSQPRIRMSEGRIFPLLGNVEEIYKRAPDVISLTTLVYSLPVDMMIYAYPDLFKQLIARPSESPERMLQAGLGMRLTYGGAHPRLRTGIHISFTPQSERSVFLEAESGPGLRGAKKMVEALPDLSQLDTPEKRFDAVVKLLTYDLNDALQEVISQLGISYEEFLQLKTEDPLMFKEIHQKAGLIYSKNNFYAILSDQANGGANSLFDVHEDQGDNPRRTDFGQCPGIGFARNYFLGLGRSLEVNKDILLPILANWRYYEN